MSVCDNLVGQYVEFVNESTSFQVANYLTLWFCGVLEAHCDYRVLLNYTGPAQLRDGEVDTTTAGTLVPLNPAVSPLDPYYVLLTYLLLPLVNDTSNCIIHRDADFDRLWLYVIGIIMCFTILVANFFQISAILWMKKMRTSASHLVASLSLSDCMNAVAFCFLIIPNAIAIAATQNYDWRSLEAVDNFRNNIERCGVQFGLLFTSMLSSILTLLCISTEKYVAIFYPYRYLLLINVKTKIVTIAIIWTVSLGAGQLAIYLAYQSTNLCKIEDVAPFAYRVVWAVICVLCAVLIFAEYLRIYRVASAKYHQTERVRYSVSTLSGNPSPTNSRRASLGLMPRATKNMKALKTVLILLVGFYACWLPLVIFLFIPESYMNTDEKDQSKMQQYNRTVEYLMLVSCVNSLINPLVYGLRNNWLLKTIRNLFPRKTVDGVTHESKYSEMETTLTSTAM